ncbi:MAG: ATP-binding protein [Gemmatimonadaceae bacterium]
MPRAESPATASARPAARVLSLQAELLASLALFGAAALLLSVLAIVGYGMLRQSTGAPIYLTAILVSDAVLFVALGALQIRRLVLRPIAAMAAAADAIAAGDLARRVPVGKSPEMAGLAEAINAMTDRLIEERTQLVRVEKMAGVGRLASGVAREIGEPLAAISRHADALRTHTAGHGEVGETAAAIEREGARIARVVRALLDYATPRRPALHAIDVSESVRRVVEQLRAQGALLDARVALTLATGLPLLAGDQGELEQALANLLLNAAESAPAGEIAVVARCASLKDLITERKQRAADPHYIVVPRAPNVRLQTWLGAAGNPAEVLQIVIADSGPGVPADDRERIFDPFYTTKVREPAEGAGLGLAIVARLVESLGGAIWVRRSREGGAAFVVLFPIRDAGALPGPASVALARAGV